MPRRVIRPAGRVVERGMVIEESPDASPAQSARGYAIDVEDDVVVHRSVTNAAWSPAQIVSLAIGSVFTLLGAVALARTGLNLNNLSSQHVNSAGLHHTALLALIEFIAGLFLLGVGAVPGGSRPSMNFFGVLALGFGIVVAADPTTMHAALGVHGGHGVLYILCGVILLMTSMVAPVIFDTDRRRYVRSSDSRSYYS